MRSNIDDILFKLFIYSERSKVKRIMTKSFIGNLLNCLELNEMELNYLAAKLK